MNEDIGYVELFFCCDKGLAPAQATERITDLFPAVVVLCNSERHKVHFANLKIPGSTGKEAERSCGDG